MRGRFIEEVCFHWYICDMRFRLRETVWFYSLTVAVYYLNFEIYCGCQGLSFVVSLCDELKTDRHGQTNRQRQTDRQTETDRNVLENL